MPVFEMETKDGRKFQVDAPDMQTAADSLGKHAGSPVDTASSFLGGVIEGVPIVGPMIKGGAQKAAAGIRSVMSGEPYEKELEAVRGYAERTTKQHPVAETAGEVAGGVGSLAGVGATATGAKLLGISGDSLLG